MRQQFGRGAVPVRVVAADVCGSVGKRGSWVRLLPGSIHRGFSDLLMDSATGTSAAVWLGDAAATRRPAQVGLGSVGFMILVA